MTKTSSNIKYTIDASDKIISVDGEWDRFAAENEGPPELSSGNILHRSFWDCISGDATEHAYRQVLAKVRLGNSLNFSLRCDSPTQRRFLTLRVAPAGNGCVQFETETVRIEERDFQALFCTNSDKVIEMVIVCSWCHKIKTGVSVWQECEDAVRSLGLFENESMPSLSHGMCDACYRTVVSEREATPDALAA